MCWKRGFAWSSALLALTLHPALAPAQESGGGSAPVTDGALIEHAVSVLLDRQEVLDRAQGSGEFELGTGPFEWPYEGVYREQENGHSVIPLGYRIGGTAIVAWSLLEAPGWSEDSRRRDAVERALRFVLEAIGHPRMDASFVSGYDVRNWGHVYALRFLLRLRELECEPVSLQGAVRRAIPELIALLERGEIPGAGGWNYSRSRRGASPSTFMTAPAVQCLIEAARLGETVDGAVIERALDSLEKARLETGAFQYSTSDRKTGEGFEAVPGAIARMPVIETTRLLAGRGSAAELRRAIDAFFEHWTWLEKRRKQTGTHVAPYMIAPYYFYYAHLYAAQAIEQLPAADRPAYRSKLRERILEVREESGGWNDRVFDRSEAFGTAMIALALLQPTLPAPKTWRVAGREQDERR